MPPHFAHFAIAVIAIASLGVHRERGRVFSRKRSDWIVDLVSLGVHFLAIPTLQTLTVFAFLATTVPQLKGTLSIGWGAALIAYLVIDYGWYWNHRAFHGESKLWNLHQIHHSPRSLDIFASARNSVWSPLFMVYFWLIPVVIFLASDPYPFLSFSAFGLLVNFWGHSSFTLAANPRLNRVAAALLVQPEDHFWHHSAENPRCNYGTVLNIWDRLHGTWYRPMKAPKQLGFTLEMSLARKLFFPF